jgi:hypothetical protein
MVSSAFSASNSWQVDLSSPDAFTGLHQPVSFCASGCRRALIADCVLRAFISPFIWQNQGGALLWDIFRYRPMAVQLGKGGEGNKSDSQG